MLGARRRSAPRRRLAVCPGRGISRAPAGVRPGRAIQRRQRMSFGKKTRTLGAASVVLASGLAFGARTVWSDEGVKMECDEKAWESFATPVAEHAVLKLLAGT